MSWRLASIFFFKDPSGRPGALSFQGVVHLCGPDSAIEGRALGLLAQGLEAVTQGDQGSLCPIPGVMSSSGPEPNSDSETVSFSCYFCSIR